MRWHDLCEESHTMKTTSLLSIAAAVLLTFASAAPAWAGTISFDDDLTKVSGTSIDDTLEGVTFEGLNYEKTVAFLLPSSDPYVAANFTNPFDDSTIGLGTIAFDFGSMAVSSVEWLALTNDSDFTSIKLLNGLTTVHESLNLDTFTSTGSTALSFSGFGLFDRVEISITGNGNGAFLMDDLSFEAVAVPLPPAAYMGLGLLAGIALLRRRRRRQLALI